MARCFLLLSRGEEETSKALGTNKRHINNTDLKTTWFGDTTRMVSSHKSIRMTGLFNE